MNTTLVRTGLFLLLFCLAAPLAQSDTPMEECWEKVGKASKKLEAGLKDPQEADKAVYLELAGVIKSESLKAREFEPKMVQTLPEDQREAFVKSFRKDLDAFQVEVDKLITALQASQWPDAQKAFEAMRQDKKEGHKAYRKKEEKKTPQP